MASTSCSRYAQELLDLCLKGARPPREAIRRMIDEGCDAEFFRIVIEGISDRFDPSLSGIYAHVMSHAIDRLRPMDPARLSARYEAIREPRACTLEPRDVYVLSRVTLGADIAITSIVLDGVKRRFPDAAIHLIAPAKSAALFEADSRIQHIPVEYPRSAALLDRLDSWLGLSGRISGANYIVIDPDSRLTQLGLLPVCADNRYFLFESRAYGGLGDEDLSTLTRRWLAETFGIRTADAYLSAHRVDPDCARPYVSVSLGVGHNAAKRLPGDFENRLLESLAQRFATVWIDKGAGGEEAERVDRAIARIAPNRIRLWTGSFAGFASLISQSDAYIGYDSAGQHAAAASGVPLVTIFAGYPSERMFARWHPTGPGPIEVVKVGEQDPVRIYNEAIEALDRVLAK